MYKIKDELKDDQQELLEEKNTLVDLIGEAQGLLEEYQVRQLNYQFKSCVNKFNLKELKAANDSGIQ